MHPRYVRVNASDVREPLRSRLPASAIVAGSRVSDLPAVAQPARVDEAPSVTPAAARAPSISRRVSLVGACMLSVPAAWDWRSRTTDPRGGHHVSARLAGP